ncbi:MAG: DUF255 domain-containing protein [Vicinamibacterales bacterium]
MGQIRLRSSVAWLPWGSAAFDRAREEQKPLLLSISAPWSAACREMDRVCYEHGEIADEINRWCVPVRVDADRRPDVAERYDLGGLPSTVFLNTDGEMLGGGTFVPPERFREALTRVRQGASVARAAPGTPGSPEGLRYGDDRRPPDADTLTAQVFALFDREHGGFGGAPKFPIAPPLRLALDLYRDRQSSDMAECITRTLDAMGWGGLYDENTGGFHRCAARADWGEPQPEKLLTTNAALLDLYLEAGTTLGNERWLARAADVVEFIQGTLAIGPGEGWRMSDQSDATRYSDVTALVASSLLRASSVFNDPSLRALALQSLETVVLTTYRPGHGVAHCAGGVRGLLTDHVAMICAHLDAWDLTADVVYQMMAEELALFVQRVLWDAGEKGFRDRATGGDDELGLLRQPLRPFDLNCEAAIGFHRLAASSPDGGFDQFARSALDAAAERATDQGPMAAHYLLALRTLSR